MATVPATIKAVTVQPDKSVKVTDVPRPKLNHQDEIIIQVHSCAQNPTDWKSVAQGRATAGNIVGNDLAGIVVEAGSDVTNVKVGDRVIFSCENKIVADDRLHRYVWARLLSLEREGLQSMLGYLRREQFVFLTRCR